MAGKFLLRAILYGERKKNNRLRVRDETRFPYKTDWWSADIFIVGNVRVRIWVSRGDKPRMNQIQS